MTVPGSEPSAQSVVLDVDGEIDLASAGLFRRALLDALETHGYDVTLDMSRVTFMDSAGVDALAVVFREVDAHRAHISVTGLSDMIVRMLVLLSSGAGASALPPAAEPGGSATFHVQSNHRAVVPTQTPVSVIPRGTRPPAAAQPGTGPAS